MSSELFRNIITQPCSLLLIGTEDQSKLKLVGSVKSWLWRNFYEAIRFIVPIHLVRMMLEEAWTKDASPLQQQQQQQCYNKRQKCACVSLPWLAERTDHSHRAGALLLTAAVHRSSLLIGIGVFFFYFGFSGIVYIKVQTVIEFADCLFNKP